MGLCCYWKITSICQREERGLVYRFSYLASSRVLFEGLAVGAGYFGTLQLRKHGATRPLRLVTYSLWVFKPSPFCSSFLGAPRGTALTKSILSRSGATISPGFTLWP